MPVKRIKGQYFEDLVAYTDSAELLGDLLTESEVPFEIKSFDDFVQNICAKSYPNYDFNTWHVRLLSHLVDETILDPVSKFLLAVLPRYHLKSTILGYFSIIYRMLTSYGDGMYCSYKDELCVVPDTKIRTPHGYKNIDSLKIGNSVLTHTGDYKRITEIFKRSINEKILKLTLDNGEIVLITKNHPILKDLEWVMAKRLKSGDFISKINANRKLDCLWKDKTFAEYFGEEKAKNWGSKISKTKIGKKNPKTSQKLKGRIYLDRRSPLLDFVCPICSEKFQSKDSDRVCCSEECQYRYLSEIYRGMIPVWKGKPSHTKGKTYEEIQGDTDRAESRKRKTKDGIKEYNLKNPEKLLMRAKKQALTMVEKWKDPEFAKKIVDSQGRKPTKIELKLDNLLQNNFPNQWRYVGDGQIWIGGKNPDYINIDDKKLIVELLGCYYHGCPLCYSNRSLDKSISSRIENYKKYGFDTLVIWEHELKDEENAIKLIKNFNELRHTKVLNVEEVEYKGYVYNLEVRKNHSYVGKGIVFHNCNYHLSNIKNCIRANQVLSNVMADRSSQSDFNVNYKIGARICRVFGSGIFSVKRGIHTDLLTVCDDLLGNVENPMVLTELDKAKRIFETEVTNIPNKDCPMFVFGTPIDYNDLLYSLKDNPNYKSIWLPALYPDPEHDILWEKKYDKEWLQRRKGVTSGEWRAFSTEFLLTPVMATEAFITREEVDKVIDKTLKNYSVYMSYNKEDKHVVAGFDVGKRRHPSHLSVFVNDESDNLIMFHQSFLDGFEYNKQIEFLSNAIENFKIDKLYYDATRSELEDRGLETLKRICVPIKFTGRGERNQDSYARDFADRIEKKTIKLIDDDRFISQILSLTGDLKAPESPMGHADCVDDQTEVLTLEGWKFFKDLSFEDGICTLNSSNYNVEYQKPTNLIIENYIGKMYHIKNTQIDQLVTPRHNLFVKQKKNYELKFPDDIEGKKVQYKKDGIWKGHEQEFFEIDGLKRNTHLEIPMDQFLKFVGYYVSEGCLRHNKDITICQKSGWKSNRMYSDLESLPFKVHHSGDKRLGKDDGGVSFCSKIIGRWIKENVGTKAINKHFPNNFLSLSSRQLKIMLDAYILGDGSSYEWTTGKDIGASTVSKLLSDQLQEIALKVGWSANIYWTDDNIGRLGMFGTGNYRGYSIKFIRYKNNPMVHKHSKTDSWEDYEGKVYCVTVPNHIMYIRRNGKPSWTGNSFWSCALAVGAYQDYYAKDRKKGFSYLGDAQELYSHSERRVDLTSRGLPENICKICGNRTFDLAPDGKRVCRKCFTMW